MCMGGVTPVQRSLEYPKPDDLPDEVPVMDTSATPAPKQTASAPARTTSRGTGLKIPTGV